MEKHWNKKKSLPFFAHYKTSANPRKIHSYRSVLPPCGWSVSVSPSFSWPVSMAAPKDYWRNCFPCTIPANPRRTTTSTTTTIIMKSPIQSALLTRSGTRVFPPVTSPAITSSRRANSATTAATKDANVLEDSRG